MLAVFDVVRQAIQWECRREEESDDIPLAVDSELSFENGWYNSRVRSPAMMLVATCFLLCRLFVLQRQ